MSMYPSLEDMQVSHMVAAQIQSTHNSISNNHGSNVSDHHANSVSYPQLPSAPDAYDSHTLPTYAHATAMHRTTSEQALYPTLDGYMGIQQDGSSTAQMTQALVPVPPELMRRSLESAMSAPLTLHSGGLLGLSRGQVSHGIRQLLLCKDRDGKIGLKVRAASKGVFVSLVVAGSPAALAGLRFGDQLLQIDSENVAGWSDDKAMKKLRQAKAQRIELVVRDRPYERNITLHRSGGTKTLGFSMSSGGEIVSIIKDSSAARNGMLIDHQLLEVNGQNVIGLSQAKINEVIDKAGAAVTVTIMPLFVFRHMMKNIAQDLVKQKMDHSLAA